MLVMNQLLVVWSSWVRSPSRRPSAPHQPLKVLVRVLGVTFPLVTLTLVLVIHGKTDVEVRVTPRGRLRLLIRGVGERRQVVTLVVEVESEVRVAVLEVRVAHEAPLEAVVDEVVVVGQPPAALRPPQGVAAVLALLLVHVVPLSQRAEVVVTLVVLRPVVGAGRVLLPQEPELRPRRRLNEEAVTLRSPLGTLRALGGLGVCAGARGGGLTSDDLLMLVHALGPLHGAVGEVVPWGEVVLMERPWLVVVEVVFLPPRA